MARQLQTTLTGEPVQPVRISFDVRDRAATLAALRRLRCVQPDPAGGRWVWLFADEAEHLPFMVPCREVPAHVRPLVIGELRFSDDRQLVLHTLSFDRAIHGVRLLAPHLGRAAVAVRARVLNRWVDGTEPRAPAALDALLDHDVTVIDPDEKAREAEAVVDAAGARGDLHGAVAAMEAFGRAHDVPLVEDFPLYPEEETPEHPDLATTLELRFIRAHRQWDGQPNATLTDIISEAAAGAARDRPAAASRPRRTRAGVGRRRAAGQRARPAAPVRLAPEPRARRQLGEAGLWAFWRDAAAAGRREGLVVTLGVCPQPDCTCRDVDLHGFLVDDRAVEVIWEPPNVRVMSPAGPGVGGEPPGAPWPLKAVCDIDTGEVRPAEDVDEHPLLDWVRAEADGELLEELQRFWLRAKGRRPGGPRPGLDLGEAEPGELVAFEALFDGERNDAYVVDGQPYLAWTFVCPDPECSCDQVRIVFSEEAAEPGALVGAVLVKLGRRETVEQAEVTAEDGAPIALARDLWARFSRRHQVGAYLTRRRARVRALDRELLRKRPAPARTAAPPGRNDPCPCGSGRKYKRCCLGKAGTPPARR